MTKIMFWNIAQFSRNKIANPSAAVVPGNGGLPSSQAARERRQMVILDQVAAFAPDILVVVEVTTGNRMPGQLLTRTLGRGGSRALGWMLRNSPGNPDWRMVPPLQVGRNNLEEGVTVLYRGEVLNAAGAVIGQRYFTGPNRWTGGENGLTANGAGPIGDYPGPERNLLMARPPMNQPRIIPVGALHNGGTTETRRAARVAFNTAAGAAIPFGNRRSPYMVTFTEQLAAGAIRDITLFAVHSPPNGAGAVAYAATLATAADVMSPLGANEVRVVCGDFNMNLLDGGGALTASYNPLLVPDAAMNRYVLGVEPLAGWIPANADQAKGYFTTHVKKAKRAVLWSTGAAPQPYPGYGYAGATVAPGLYSIDNILIKQAVVPPGGNQVTIGNSVVGTPLNAAGAAPIPGVPVGTAALGHEFQAIPAGVVWPGAPNAPLSAAGLAGTLRGWNNYGRIFSTSDHFCVYAVV